MQAIVRHPKTELAENSILVVDHAIIVNIKHLKRIEAISFYAV